MRSILVLVLMIGLSGCVGIKIAGSVCIQPEILKMIPILKDGSDVSKERCIGGQIGGGVGAPAAQTPGVPEEK